MSITAKKFNIARPREEQQKDGSMKTFWDTVGKITIFTKEDGTESGRVELYSFANKTITLNAFEFKTTVKQDNYSQPAPKDDYSQPEEIRVENIPF